MPAPPWRAMQHTGSPTTVVVMASRFQVRRLRDVPRFFLDSLRIRRQVINADGALGVSLVARPLRREFLTLSAWRDRAALNGLVRTEPHRSAMRRHHPVMADSQFSFWQATLADLPIEWDDARRRLDEQHVGSVR